MSLINFLKGLDRYRTFKIKKDPYVISTDIVKGDFIKLWSPKDSNLICFYDKSLGPNGELIGKTYNNFISKHLKKGLYYHAKVNTVINDIILIDIKFSKQKINIQDSKIKLDIKKSEERHKRIINRIEKQQKIAEEKRALAQPEYDKVLNPHKNKLDEFLTSFKLLNELKDLNKLEKLLETIEKELKKVESKIEKREDTFIDRSEKWQESEKGELYEDITNELIDIQSNIEELRDKIKNILNSNS